MVTPSSRKEMAQRAVQHYNVSIRLACTVFSISQSCYYYQPKHAQENDVIADWLIQLTTVQRNWGFGLCFAYLRNIKGFIWNHKRVYRIYRNAPLCAVNNISGHHGGRLVMTSDATTVTRLRQIPL